MMPSPKHLNIIRHYVAFSYQLKAQSGRELQASLKASPEVSFLVEDALGTGVFEGTDNAKATLSHWLGIRG